MILLSLSDFHLGKGRFLSNGHHNILEDFFEDDRFIEFLHYYSTGIYEDQEVHLVLNGDILNMIQIDDGGEFSHIMDEEFCVHALTEIYRGHRPFFKALREFQQKEGKEITFIIGNHDAGMAFEKAQEKLKELVGEIDICFHKTIHGVYFEHGHRFEAINSVEGAPYFLKGPKGQKILNLPWGSLFCVHVLPQLKSERPYIDKVRPIVSYIIWCLLHDFTFFLKMSYVVLRYLFVSRGDKYISQNKNFKTTLKILKQVTIYPRYEKMAKKILKTDPNIKAVVMGHTHVLEWRKFPGEKLYFNTGTWNPIPSVDAGMHESKQRLSYAKIELSADKQFIIRSSLNVWQGQWRPFREEVTLEEI